MPEETTETNPEKSTALEDTEKYLEKVEIISAKTGQSILEVQGTYDQTMLEVLDVSDMKAVQQVTQLANCAKNIPAALATIAIKKGIAYLSSLPITGTALDIAQILEIIQRIQKQYETLMQLIEMLKDPETLLMMLANAKILEGQSLLDKIDDIKSKFPGVPGLDGVLNDLNALDLCNAELSLDSIFGGAKKLPLTEIPKAVKRLGNVVTDNLDRTAKGDYNALLFKIREGTVKDEQYLEKLRAAGDKNALNQYNEMLTLVNVLAYSYHDDVKKTSDLTQLTALRTKYQQNVATELQKNGNNWNAEIVSDFKRRTSTIDTCVTSDAESIGSFYNPTPQGESPKYPTTGNQDYCGLSKTSFDLIIYYEVGGEAAYNNRYSKPTWPGGASGVTIGIGYDIGYNTAASLKADWSGIISDGDIDRLASCAGIKGSSARNAVLDVNDITIPWEAAKAVFVKKTLPRFKAECIRAFPGSDKLHPDAFGSLVSLVFNRGPSTSGKNREEMGRIRAALLGQTKVTDIYEYIADQLIAMKRIWANTNLTGLLKRREKEAELVRSAKSSSSNNVA
jgi:GH24 family phage-related lysozyme (muramidase)